MDKKKKKKKIKKKLFLHLSRHFYPKQIKNRFIYVCVCMYFDS